MTPEFEALVKKAVEDGLLPNAVALARDKSGKMNYTFAHGPSSVAPDSPPITPSTLLTLASMTKLITTLSILQLIEAGSLTLDTDVTRLLPALSSQPVLSTPPTAAPTPRKSPITVRHLLTHTAGTGYLFLSPQLQEWAKGAERALPIPLRKSPLSGDRTVDKRFGYPLLFEPGSAWAYGSGLDWAGKLVEVVSGQKLGEYVWERVLRPVGVVEGGMTFNPPDEGVAGMAVRGKDGKVREMEMEYDGGNEGFGGEGLFGGLGEYVKVVESLLRDDGKIVKPETAKLLFEGLLRGEEKRVLNESMQDPDWVVGFVPQGVEYDWSAGGLLTTADVGKRKKGFLQWGGAWNLCWFIDRESGVCGVFGTQVAPPGDTVVREYMKAFEDAIYSKL